MLNDDENPNIQPKPVPGQIQSKDLTNILIAVVRYFGGTLLGVRGLINAYKQAAADAIEHAEIIEKQVKELYEAAFDYLQMNDVMKLLKDENLEKISQDFNLNCRLVFAAHKNNAHKMKDLFSKISNLELKFLRIE